MYRYIARENIDHFIELLNGDSLAPDRRAVITRLLMDEEDKLGHDLEQLDFAETRAAKGRELLNHAQAQLAKCHPHQRPQMERLVQNFAALQMLLDGFCNQLERKANSRL